MLALKRMKGAVVEDLARAVALGAPSSDFDRGELIVAVSSEMAFDSEACFARIAVKFSCDPAKCVAALLR